MAEITKKEEISPLEEPVETPKKGSSKIEVDPDVLKGILSSLEKLEKANKEKDSKIEVLEGSVGRYKLEEAESKLKPKGLPQAKLMVYDGKVVVAYKLVKNNYLYNPLNPNVPYGEDLKMKLTFLDGTDSSEIEFVSFIRTTERANVEKVGEESAVDSKGNSFSKWVVEFIDKNIYSGRISIDPQFINP